MLAKNARPLCINKFVVPLFNCGAHVRFLPLLHVNKNTLKHKSCNLLFSSSELKDFTAARSRLKIVFLVSLRYN